MDCNMRITIHGLIGFNMCATWRMLESALTAAALDNQDTSDLDCNMHITIHSLLRLNCAFYSEFCNKQNILQKRLRTSKTADNAI